MKVMGLVKFFLKGISNDTTTSFVLISETRQAKTKSNKFGGPGQTEHLSKVTVYASRT